MSEANEPFDFELIVIGSGPAGQRAAVQAAKLGRRVAVVERMPSLGGVCILTGTIPSKTFREAVLSSINYQPFEPVHQAAAQPSMANVLSRVQEVMMAEVGVIRDQLSRNGVSLLQGSARFTSKHELEIFGFRGTQTVTAERFLIAVGTRPAEPEDLPVDGRVILTSDEVLAMEEIPKSMVVIGGGVIGIEYASMFAHLGVDVALIDRHERPIEFIDHQIVDELLSQMEAKSVDFHLGTSIKDISVCRGTQGHATVTLDNGVTIETDTVLFSVGRIAATDTLDLGKIALKTDPRGRIPVDEDYRTELPHVWAAGDVIGFPALAATSSEQGRIAACRMFGVDAEDMGETYPYGIYSIPEISMVGATEEELNKRKIPYTVGIARYDEIARGQILGDETGLFKMLFHHETGALLGVHCIGTGATELIHVGQAVLKLGGGIDYFLETVFNYPTLAECYKVAAYSAANRMGYRQVSMEAPDLPTNP